MRTIGAVLEGDQWQKIQFEEEDDDDVRNEVHMEMYSLYYVLRGYFSGTLMLDQCRIYNRPTSRSNLPTS